MKIKIKNAKVLFWEPKCHARQTDLYLADGLIAAIGDSEEHVLSEQVLSKQVPGKDFVADKVIDANGKLVIPGLINCHTHAYMSVFRNYADDLPFDEWLFKKIMPAEDALKAEDAYWCNLLSCLEMIKTGTTCFVDMHMFKQQSVRAVTESGMRAVISRGLVGESADDPAAKARLAEAFEEMEAAAGNSRITFMLGPHAIYSCGEGLLRELPSIAKEKNLGLNIHVSESRNEFDTCMQKHGCSPVAYLNSLDFFNVPTLAAHCVHLTGEDIKILAARKVSVAANPVSNMKLGNGFAPATKLLAAGVNLCVGTDGASSNNALNMLRELSILSYVNKGVDQNALSLPADQTLKCGILGGAKALGLDTKIGSIEVGKRADLVLIDLNKPWLQPVNNPVSSLIYSANGSEVDTVIIDGEIVMENGRVSTLDEDRIISEVEKIRQRLL
jgi:5-methylthioadenosine/S-adenosylhomocysteine deaminase